MQRLEAEAPQAFDLAFLDPGQEPVEEVEKAAEYFTSIAGGFEPLQTFGDNQTVMEMEEHVTKEQVTEGLRNIQYMSKSCVG